MGLQIHESVGHPIELDRVLGEEANFAGTSFLTLDKLNKLRYGSDIVNVVADARLEHGPGLGSFAYDDEGVPAQCTDIIKDGEFRGYLSNRETAHLIGLKRSSGTMRTESWNRLPIIRMTNISLKPGTWKLDNLIADTDDAILMETNRSWSIDDRRYQFQFSTEIGWEIKGGKRGRMLKNPSYSGITTEFWNSCDAICGADEWVLWGTPNCGKGQPMQTMGTGHGASPSTIPERSNRDGVRQIMSPERKASSRKSKPDIAATGAAGLLAERELRAIIENVLRFANSSEADETEVHVDEVDDSLTRFANNAIHQNVAERGLTVSVRTVVDGRTARATTNRVDEDSLRGAIEASLSLAHSQPKDPRLLPMPGKQKYRKVNRFSVPTAALTPEDRARAVKRACDLAIAHGQVAAGIFASGLSQTAMGNSRGLFAAYRETHAEFSITMQAVAGGKLGESEFRECAGFRSVDAGGDRKRQGASGVERAGIGAGEIHGDTGTVGGARPRGVSFLRFFGDGAGGQTFVPERSNGQGHLREEHFCDRRRLSSTATGRAV